MVSSSLRDFRTASLDVAEQVQDDRLDRTVPVASLGVVGGGLAFLLAMIFVFFPEWMRLNLFAPGPLTSVTHTMLLRPAAYLHDEPQAEMPAPPWQTGFGVEELSQRFVGADVSTGQDQEALVSVGSPPPGPTGIQTTSTTGRHLFSRAAGFEFDAWDQGALLQTQALTVSPVPAQKTGGPAASTGGSPPAGVPGNDTVQGVTAGTPPPPAATAPGNAPATSGPTPGNSPPTAGPAHGNSPPSAGPGPGNSPPNAGPPSGIGGGGQDGGPAAAGGGGKRESRPA